MISIFSRKKVFFIVQSLQNFSYNDSHNCIYSVFKCKFLITCWTYHRKIWVTCSACHHTIWVICSSCHRKEFLIWVICSSCPDKKVFAMSEPWKRSFSVFSSTRFWIWTKITFGQVLAITTTKTFMCFNWHPPQV